MRLLISAILLLAVGFFQGCGESPGDASRTAGDAEGTPRLAVLSPAHAIILVDLGLEDLIVAKHDYDLALSDRIPPVGNQNAIDYEALLRAEPTHVLLEWSAGELPERLTEISQREGWAILNRPLRTIDDIAQLTDDLFLSFADSDFGDDTPANPSQLVVTPDERFDTELPSARLARAWSLRPGRLQDAGRVLMLASTSPIYGALGPGSFHHEILERIGGTPAISEGSPWMELDAEDIRRINPDVIVLIAPRPKTDTDPFGDRAPSMDEIIASLGRAGELGIAAIGSRRVMLIDDPHALTPSTAMGRFADRLADQLSAWAEAARSVTGSDADDRP